MTRTQARFNRRISKVIARFDLVDEESLQSAVETAGSSRSLAEVLVEEKGVEEEVLLSALALETGVAPIDLDRVEIDDSLSEILAEKYARAHCALPVAQVGRILTVAVSNPYDIVQLDSLRDATDRLVQPVISTDFRIREMIDSYYGGANRKLQDFLDGIGDPELELQEDQEEIDTSVEELTSQGGDAPAVKLVNHLIYQAIRDRASDIHIEPFDRQVRVRYRVDGVLREGATPPHHLQGALISRLKIMAGLDIAERRVPQDGKFQLRIEGRHVDFRVSTLPTIYGEKVVLRILDSTNLSHNLETLGFEDKALEDIRSAINVPYGMMLVTGPTGSGKSTTLYSCVSEVLRPEENIVTVEDPVEYQISGVIQVPVNNKRGLTFSAALRSILRQDPDTVMIGEIRDLETAEIAIKAAMTGHLVLSTLHTNDAPSTVTRLVDMGVDPFLVSSAIQCVAAQRLCRRLCPDCCTPLEGPVPADRLLEIGFTEGDLENLEIHEPVGCNRCTNGYRGRFALLETMPIDEELRRLIVSGASVLEIKSEAIEGGMTTLRRCGLLNVMRGKTSLEEVLRVTKQD